MSRKALQKDNDDTDAEVNLADTCVGQALEDSSIEDIVKPQPSEDVVPDSNLSDRSGKMSTSQLIAEQNKDPEISNLIQKAVDDKEVSQNPVCYYLRNGILMRKWRPPDVADEEWVVKHQIVVPKVYRSEILSIAHETPLGWSSGRQQNLP